MIDAISAWVRDLAVMALILAFAEMLLPRNDLRKFARVVIGLVLVAIILGSLVDLSSLENTLATPLVPDVLEPTGTGARDYAAEGNRIAQAGLEVAGRDLRARFERQVQSLARLASGAEGVDARVELGPSGNLSGIHVVLRITPAGQQDGFPYPAGETEGSGGGLERPHRQGGSQSLAQAQGREETAAGHEERVGEESSVTGPAATRDGPGEGGAAGTALATEVERSIRDFYGLDEDVPVVVEVRG